MKARIALIGLLALALAPSGACSKRYRIEIQSDVCWSGNINGDQAIDDCGNVSYKVVGALTCAKVTKKTVAGYLRIRMNGGPWAETTDPLGSVEACP